MLKPIPANNPWFITSTELYINGEAENKKDAQEEIKSAIEEDFESLIKLSSLYGKTAIEQVFRKRLDAVTGFLYNYNKLDYEYEKILKQLLNCKKEDGNEFSINEKLNFIDILLGFNICDIKVVYIHSLANPIACILALIGLCI